MAATKSSQRSKGVVGPAGGRAGGQAESAIQVGTELLKKPSAAGVIAKRTHKSQGSNFAYKKKHTMLSASAQPFEPMPSDFGLCFANGHAQAIFCSATNPGHPEHEVISHVSDEAIDEFIPDAFD
ncbi:hypothetical protein THAOC_09024, partial [Thalassiosira oceanica]